MFKGAQEHLTMNWKNRKEYKQTFSGLQKKGVSYIFAGHVS